MDVSTIWIIAGAVIALAGVGVALAVKIHNMDEHVKKRP